MSQSLTLTKKSDKELTKLQKQFNNYVQKIQDLKIEKEKLTHQLEVIRVRVSAELVPLEAQMIEFKVKMVQMVDKQYELNFFKKKEKEKMKDFILKSSHELIDNYGKVELKEIFEKHSDGESFDQANQEAEQAVTEKIKKMMEAMFGIEFEDDADVSSPEKMQAYVDEKMSARIEQEDAAYEARQAKRKKTDKQIKKEEKLKLETQNLNKTARAIYTDLVKEFHPDREPDEEKRRHKTEIMHKVTEAYEQNDLFRLLQLKVELQATSPDTLNLADDQLKYYNKMLKEQINELDEELYEMKGGYGSLYQRLGGDEQTMKKRFATEIRRLKKTIKQQKDEIEQLADPNVMRMFFRDYEINPRPNINLFDLLDM